MDGDKSASQVNEATVVSERDGRLSAGGFMKQGMFGLLLALAAACTDSADNPARAAGEEHASDAAAKPDAGPKQKVSPDVHTLLITALLELERTLLARCPCYVEKGLYETKQACVDAVSLGRSWVDCANAADLGELDDVQARANLRCTIEELSQRTECLMGSACTDEAVATCMTQSLGCPMLPLDPLSQVAVECTIAFSH